MKNALLIFLLLLPLVSCSKKGVTPTTVKLTVGGMMNLANGIGTGGGIIFGKSAQGEIFGHVISNNEETFVMSNGDWNFYAFLWSSTSLPASPMNDIVFCGKSSQKLSGADVSVSMNLTNSNCNDPEYSNGKTYLDLTTSKIRFADVFMEDCDDLNAAKGFTCGINNQGSALSYRMVFRNFNKNSATGFDFGAQTLVSACQKVNNSSATDLFHKGLPVNFPSGNGQTPFVVSVELFLGNDQCIPDEKGIHTIVMNQGLGV